jgi:hypothetical protein
MKPPSAVALLGLAVDIEAELEQLKHLANDIAAVQVEIRCDPGHARLFYENLALKLHNFYTGCERIFNLIVAELNGAPLSGYDWHQRLLERMAVVWEDRPPLLTRETVRQLREYLGFRHVVRNLYGYELDTERIERLVERYPAVWQAFYTEVKRFADWLRILANSLAQTSA